MTVSPEFLAPERASAEANDIPAPPPETKKRSVLIFFAAALAVLAAAFFAGRPIASGVALRDAFDGAASRYEAILCAARLLLPILSEFLAVYLFAFSPLCMTACAAALAARGVRVAFVAAALIPDAAKSAPALAAFALYAAGALALAAFCAASCALSPRLRTLGFSTLSGRREALSHTAWFLILSGAASVSTLASALVIHFA